MEPIRVLHCGLASGIGGAEMFAISLYRNIDRERIQFDFLTSHNGCVPFEDEIQNYGGNIYRCMYSKRESFVKAYTSLNECFSKKIWMAFHMHSTFKSFYQPVCSAKKSKMETIIVHSHCNANVHSYQNNLQNRMLSTIGEKKLVLSATKLIACSQSAGEYMFGHHPFEIINNGIDTQKFKFSENIRKRKRNELDLEDNFVVGVAAHISHIKNPEYIIEIFRCLHSKNPRSILLWAGDGEKRSDIESLISRYNLENSVLLLGERKDVSELMQAMDCFILPSYSEGLGIAAIEAQAAGLPVFLSTGVPKTAKIIDTVEFLSIEEQPDVWAEKILKTVGKQRFDTTSEIIKAGFDIKQTARRMEEIYMENL